MFIQITSVVKPAHVVMARSIVFKSCLMAELCFDVAHFSCIPIYTFGFRHKNNEYNNCFKIHIYYRCISRIQFSSSGYYKLKYYHQTKMLHRCSYKIITIIKILQCYKLIKKQYNHILDYNGDQLKFRVSNKKL